MASGISRSSSQLSDSASRRPLWQRELFDNDTLTAFDRIRKATKSSYAVFAATPSASLNADITTVYSAITANEYTIDCLAQQQEDLEQESRLELIMRETLELEAKRLEESLAIHRREIENIGVRVQVREDELADLKDLQLVILVQALREETPEEWRNDRRNSDEGVERQSSESRK